MYPVRLGTIRYTVLLRPAKPALLNDLYPRLETNDRSAACLLLLVSIWSHLTQTLLPHREVHSSQHLVMLLVHVRECLQYTRVSLERGQCCSRNASDEAENEELGVECVELKSGTRDLWSVSMQNRFPTKSFRWRGFNPTAATM